VSTNSDLRSTERVVQEALSWVGTPYIPHAQVKGSGCDCATILVGVYSNAGVIDPFKLTDKVGVYPVEWNLHRDEERYLEAIYEWCEDADGPDLGRIVLFRVGRTVAHSGICVSTDPVRLVHAWMASRSTEVMTWNPWCDKHFSRWLKPKGWR
jgi:cell wall-associated NlpC family hydrolase